MKIAFLGTGLMGAPMIRSLANSGHDLTIWNRSPEKSDVLEGGTIQVAADQATAVACSELVISMLTDGKAVQSVASSCKPGAGHIWIDMSSTKPAEARSLAAKLAGTETRFMDAPVSGGTKGAQNASLAIMCGGTETLFREVEPVLSSMGRPTLVGGVGSGQLAKLANQAIVGVTIAAVAEATLLLEAGGADADAVRAALKGGFADSIMLQQHGARMSRRDFKPGGLSSVQIKDLENVLDEAGDLVLPTTRHVLELYRAYVNDHGGGPRDHSGLFEELLAMNRDNLASMT